MHKKIIPVDVEKEEILRKNMMTAIFKKKYRDGSNASTSKLAANVVIDKGLKRKNIPNTSDVKDMRHETKSLKLGHCPEANQKGLASWEAMNPNQHLLSENNLATSESIKSDDFGFTDEYFDILNDYDLE